MYQLIQGVITEYILGYYVKYENAVCRLLYKDGIPYILSHSSLYTMETSLVLFRTESRLLIQNIFELWGMKNKFVGDNKYLVDALNNEKIMISLTTRQNEFREIALINNFSLYDTFRYANTKKQLLTLLLEPLLFFENVREKEVDTLVMQFFDVYKCCIHMTLYNYTCKYMVAKQLVIEKGVIVYDIFVIIMNMYTDVIMYELLCGMAL